MKKSILLIISTALLVSACGEKKSPAPIYTEGSNEYKFFKTISDSLQISILDPEKSNEIIRTKKFSVWSGDIMHVLYQQLSRYNIKSIPKEQVTAFIHQLAKQEAEKKLLLIAAADNHIRIPEDTLKTKLELLYQSSGSEEEFLKQISQRGFTIDFVREDIKTTLTIQKYIQEFVYNNITASEEEIQTEYAQSDSATVRHILMMTQGKTQSEKEDIYKKMESVLDKARSGEDFAELAQRYSEDPGSKENGGLYEKFSRGQMVKPFEDASFNLPIGSISDIVETQYGYHIIKVIGREKLPLEEIRSKISNSVTSTKKREAIIANVEYLKEKYQYEELVKL